MAYGSLSRLERRRVVRVLQNLKSSPSTKLAHPVLKDAREPVYIAKASPAVRLIYNRSDDGFTVLDIIRKDKLDAFARSGRSSARGRRSDQQGKQPEGEGARSDDAGGTTAGRDGK